jgi:hypothetical protein
MLVARPRAAASACTVGEGALIQHSSDLQLLAMLGALQVFQASTTDAEGVDEGYWVLVAV